MWIIFFWTTFGIGSIACSRAAEYAQWLNGSRYKYDIGFEVLCFIFAPLIIFVALYECIELRVWPTWKIPDAPYYKSLDEKIEILQRQVDELDKEYERLISGSRI